MALIVNQERFTFPMNTISRPTVNSWLKNLSFIVYHWRNVNTLRPRQYGCLFPNDIFKSIFFNENVQILIKISLTFAPKAPINNIPALVQIMAWRRPGDKPLSEPMMVKLLTHICVTRPQWVKTSIRDHHSFPYKPILKYQWLVALNLSKSNYI